MRNFIILLMILVLVFVTGCEQTKPIGGDTDEHGCLIAAGYTWCESKQKCLRTWEEPCPIVTNFEECASAGFPIMESYPRQCRTAAGNTFVEELAKLTIDEAMAIAEQSECVGQGKLLNKYMYNEITRTWWIELDIDKEGCAPACVVKADKTAEINWRCTGLLV